MKLLQFIKKKKHNNIISCMKNNSGFSLAELAITIAILAILAMILVPSFLSYNERSKMQKDTSASEEITNAIVLNLSNDKANDEIMVHSKLDNVSCYIDKNSESAYTPIITKQAGDAASNGVVSQYIFDASARTADETPFYLAGNMRGVTITFEPIKNGSRSFYRIEDGIINKFTSDGNTKLKDLPYFYNATKAIVGPEVEIDSSTYENSEFTVFIRLGTTGGQDAINQDAVTAYGQFSGTNLTSDPIAYEIADGRVIGDTGEDYENNDSTQNNPENNDTPSYDEDDLGGSGLINPDNNSNNLNPVLVDGNQFNNLIPDSSTSIVFTDVEAPTGAILTDLSAVGNKSIVGWNNGSTWTISTQKSGVKIVAHSESYCMFQGKSEITSIDFSNLDTSRTTNMSSMFNGLSKLTSLDLSNFNTENVLDMGYMFNNCSSLQSLDLSSFNTGNVKNMKSMFGGCSGLQSLNASHLETHSVTDMDSMFKNCSGLTTLNVSGFNTSKTTTIGNMFSGCSQLTSLNLSNFDTKNVTSMLGVFSGCSSLKTVNISNFNTSNVGNMSGMFSNCTNLQNVNLSSFKTDSLINMTGMFINCTGITELNLSTFNTSSVKMMGDLFRGCSNLKTIYVSDTWSTSSLYDFIDAGHKNMFLDCTKISGESGVKYNSSKVDKAMANYATGYLTNIKILTDLNPSNGTTPVHGSKYERGDYVYTYSSSAGGWSVALNLNVTDKNQTKYGPILESINGRPIKTISNLFANCTSLVEAPTIPDTVTEMGSAFSYCTSLKTAPIIPSAVGGMANTFKGCTAMTGKIIINANNFGVYYQCFYNVDFQEQNITLDGSSSSIDEVGATGQNYCRDCNGVCSGHASQDLNPDDGTTPQTGDTYRIGNYEYRYNQYYHVHAKTWFNSSISGWGVRCVNDVEDPGQIMESINGEPITNLYNTFYGCKSMKYAPVIPHTVLDMYQTFAYCTSLTGIVTINANPNRINQCFLDVNFEQQNLTLGGSSSILGPLKTTTT